MATIDALRDLIYERDSGLCGICGAPVPRALMHIDHITPRARGGRDTLENMQATHPRCNMRKGTGERPAPVPAALSPAIDRDLKLYDDAIGMVLTVQEIAAQQDTHPETVRRWIRAHGLRALRPGGGNGPLKVRLSDLERFLSERER